MESAGPGEFCALLDASKHKGHEAERYDIISPNIGGPDTLAEEMIRHANPVLAQSATAILHLHVKNSIEMNLLE